MNDTTTATQTEVRLWVDHTPHSAYTVEGDPESVSGELEKRGFWEATANDSGASTAYGNEPGVCDVFVSHEPSEVGWLAFLKGEESTATRHSELDRKLAELRAEYLEKCQDVIGVYIANSSEEEQLLALADNPSPRVVSAVAYSKNEKVQEAVVDIAKNEDAPNLLALVVLSSHSDHDDIQDLAEELTSKLIRDDYVVAVNSILDSADTGYVSD